MPDGTRVTYLYDGTFPGLLTAVFTAYERRENPAEIQPDGAVQQSFDVRFVTVVTEETKAQRVEAGIERRLGRTAYETVYTAFLSDDPAAGGEVFRYVQGGMAQGRRFRDALTDPRVMALDKRAALVRREAQALLQFARFSQREGDIYYASIAPQYRVLPLLMPHFFDRFRDRPFLLHDETHGEVGVSDCRRWVLTADDELTPPAPGEQERAYQRMWKLFYDTVAIQERINPVLRRQHMPQKYWHHLTEMREVTPSVKSDDFVAEGHTEQSEKRVGSLSLPMQTLP